MADRPPMSVLLPTTSWTDACTEVADQLGDHDELLLIHDGEDDPITERQHTPEGVRLIATGEPEYCSGKANVIAAGMAAARHDRFIWTDDDFHYPPDWLAILSVDEIVSTKEVDGSKCSCAFLAGWETQTPFAKT